MAFNLNKSDGSSSKVDLSKKSNPTSKFDLGKNETPASSNIEKTGKSKTWIFVLLGLLLLGIGTWYFMSNSKPSNVDSNESITPSVVDSPSNSDPAKSQNVASASPVDSPTSSISTQQKNPSSSSVTTPNASDKKSDVSNNKSVGNTSKDNTSPKTAMNSNSTNKTNISAVDENDKIAASFGKASTNLSSIDKSTVKKILSYLKKNPNSTISIDGYASSEGELSVNQQLSQSRANAFKAYLISKGAAADKIIATGKGIDNPIKSNESEDGRRKNRRVEVSFK